MDTALFCKKVEKQLQRNLTTDEEETILDYIKNIKLTAHTSIPLAFKHYVDEVSKVLKKREYRNATKGKEILDIKEYQVVAIGKNAENENSNNISIDEVEIVKLEALYLLEANNVYDISKAIAPKSKTKYNYLMLDSNNLYDINDVRNKFTWLINDANPIYQTGYINLHSKLRNIKMARIGRITITSMPISFVNDTLERRRFGIGFEEFNSQALITPLGTRHQFLAFLQEYDRNEGPHITLSPFNSNRGWFRFRDAFKSLDKLTMTITDLFDDSKFVLPDEKTSFAASFNVGLTVPSTHHSTLHHPIIITDWQERLSFQYDRVYDTTVYIGRMTSWDLMTTSDISTGVAEMDDYLNGWEFYPTYAGQKVDPPDDYFISPWGKPTVDVGGLPFTLPDGLYTMTLTMQYKPRFTMVLELISEDDDDEPVK